MTVDLRDTDTPHNAEVNVLCLTKPLVIKQRNSKLDHSMINTMDVLEEWTTHQELFKAGYCRISTGIGISAFKGVSGRAA